jgi:trimethylamine--corrinoid protein Co-methyltransferase
MKNIKAKIDVLSQAEKELIHDKSLNILEKIGLKAPHGEFLNLMEEHGAAVDRQTQVIRFPRRLIEDMLGEIKANSQVERDVSKLKGRVSTQVFIVDYRTRTRRYGLMDDLMKGISLLDKLNNFDYSDAVVIPSDVQSDLADIISYQKLYTYSKKHGGSYILTPIAAEYICDMAKVMGRTESYYFQTVSPLQFMPETLEIAMVFKKKGMPSGASPFVQSMGSGPVTIAGSLLLQNAEQLACMFCTKALGGSIEGYNAGIHPLDISTLLCSFGSPNLAVSSMAGCSMANFYGLNPGSNTGLTDALLPDFQCGFEKALTSAFAALSGNCSIGCQGIVGADQGISLEQLILDNEWLSAFNYTVSGIEVTEETLAEALIHEIGIGGSFIQEEHTVRNMRSSYWTSKLFNRQAWDSVMSTDKSDLIDKACAMVEEYTSGYKSMEPVISPSMKDEIDRIAAEGVKAMNNK